MVKEAESHATDDARRRQEIEVRNQTDSLVYASERTLNEVRDRLSDGERREVEQAIEEARQALSGNDVSKMRQAQDRLQRASQPLGAAAARQPASQPPGGQTQQAQDGDVVDAEVVEDR